MSEPPAELQGICDVLNNEKDKDTERSRELRALIARWREAPSLFVLLRQDSDLAQDLRDAGAQHVYFEASRTGKGGSFEVIPKPIDANSPRSFALSLFARLVTNPLCEKLAGPCARCGNYYIKRRASQEVYCSRKCGNNATAITRRREKLGEERSKKLRLIRAALRAWKSSRKRSGDWKEWVANKANEMARETTPHITSKFITRAVTNKEIKPLRKGK